MFPESLIDKTKVTFKEDRTTYHEVPETTDTYRDESFDEPQDDFPASDEREDNYTRDQEKYDDQEQFNESEEQYHDENEFEKEQKRKLERKQEFKEEQPKLTPKQRWHRAYNKIVMQLNVSTFLILSLKAQHYLSKNLFTDDFISEYNLKSEFVMLSILPFLLYSTTAVNNS